jgi:protein SCO1/2
VNGKWKWLKSLRLMAPLLLVSLAMSPAQATQNLPAPGAYALPRIQQTPRASLLDANGAPVLTDEKLHGAITLLGFFYAHCEGAAGCPVAWSVFESVREAARRDPLLCGRLRLVFISIDPQRDTPAVLRLLEKSEKGVDDAVPWSFFTSASEASLVPFLRAMGQDVGHEVDANGSRTGTLQHMLKVFLVDQDGWVREIYSTGFLTPEAALNDARTLALANSNTGAHGGPR